MKYTVTVSRSVSQVKEIEVEADSKAEAERKALEKAPDLDFSGLEKEADYDAIGVSDEHGHMVEECDECGAEIPPGEGGSIANRHHKESCSLYADAE